MLISYRELSNVVFNTLIGVVTFLLMRITDNECGHIIILWDRRSVRFHIMS